MATSVDYIEFVCDQIKGFENVRYKKMFGESLKHCNLSTIPKKGAQN